MTVRVRIDLAYDGAGFHGFARQVDVATVQGTLEGALTRVCGLVRGDPRADGLPRVDDRVATTCAGRTDAGVHATAQVVHVDVDRDWGPAAARLLDQLADDAALVRRRLDRLVGASIAITAVTAVDDGFDARFSAGERRYRYLLDDGPVTDPRVRGLLWRVDGPLDTTAMHEGAQHLVGEHDFASLCRRADGGHTRRRLDAVAVTRGPAGGVVPPPPASWVAGATAAVHVTLRGPAFCHQQVRAITGCLVEVGRGRREPRWIATVLAARDRAAAARVAPAHGLTLEGVGYPDPWPSAPPTAA